MKLKHVIALFFAVLIVSTFGIIGCQKYDNYTKDQDKACIEDINQYLTSTNDAKKELKQRTEQQYKQKKFKKRSSPKNAKDHVNSRFPQHRPDVHLPPPILWPPIELTSIGDILRFFECLYPPMPIYPPRPIDQKGGIQSYDPDQLPSPPCYPKSVVAQLDNLEKAEIMGDAKSVGRLAIWDKSNPNTPLSFWGTGFLIATGVIATPCHVIAPLLGEDKHLKLGDQESLVIDFEPTALPPGGDKEFKILGVFGCPEKEGFDLALLDLCSSDGNSDLKACKDINLPSATPLSLFSGKFTDIVDPDPMAHIAKPSILIGYADLQHFIDPDRKAMYGPWLKDNKSNKFVVLDRIVEKDSCDKKENDSKGLEIILDTDMTTIGESGSVVVNLATDSQSKHLAKSAVIGVHTCCSAYFPDDEDKAPDPEYKKTTKCALLRRTLHNQDISSWSILGNPTLCKTLQDRKATQIDNSGGQPMYVSCSR